MWRRSSPTRRSPGSTPRCAGSPGWTRRSPSPSPWRPTGPRPTGSSRPSGTSWRSEPSDRRSGGVDAPEPARDLGGAVAGVDDPHAVALELDVGGLAADRVRGGDGLGDGVDAADRPLV